ncbi:MAG: hypothetical protein IPL53_04820 [Ignavibacteria bacterium]|nr:hypothetical protein [Ignavibacteria bacterium]
MITVKEIDISAKNEIELSYKDNIINIGYSSADFTNPQKNKFAYRLEGFDEDWNHSENKNEAIYTNLNPGKYVFKVKGTNSDGVWSSKEASLNITITAFLEDMVVLESYLYCRRRDSPDSELQGKTESKKSDRLEKIKENEKR